MSIQQTFILILALIAFTVFLLLLMGRSAWLLIVFYWLTLTLKNVVDLILCRRKGVHPPDSK